MTIPIAPALTAEQWAELASPHDYVVIPNLDAGEFDAWLDPLDGLSLRGWHVDGTLDVSSASVPALIALANAALPDGDPRKITQEMVDDLHKTVRDTLFACGEFCISKDNCDCNERAARVEGYVAALASFLPPEGT